MNKIVLEKNSIIDKTIDDSIKIEENNFFDIKTLNINIMISFQNV